MLAESPRRPGPIDLAGAVTGTAGLALLVYGLSKAATGPDGMSHWGDGPVLASLAAAAVLIVSFVLIELQLASAASDAGPGGGPQPSSPPPHGADRNRPRILASIHRVDLGDGVLPDGSN